MTLRPPGVRGGVRRYRSGDALSYALGEWPALEALRHRAAGVEALLLDPRLAGARRRRLLEAATAAGVPWRDDERTLRSLRHRSDALALALVRTCDDPLAPAGDHLVLVGTRHPGNLGAALRSALGFDLRDVALVGAAVDPWSPHVLRASQGARFALRVARFRDWSAYRTAHGAQTPTLFAAPQAERRTTPLPGWRPQRPAALVFGPEWSPERRLDEAPDGAIDATAAEHAVDAPRVHIPQHPDLESHNLAVAVGIALYALRHGAC